MQRTIARLTARPKFLAAATIAGLAAFSVAVAALPSMLDAGSRPETLGPQSVTLGGLAIEASATLSGSKILVTYRLPADAEASRPPRLAAHGRSRDAIETRSLNDGQWLAVFPTDAGAPPYDIDFGPLVVKSPNPTAVTVALDGLPAWSTVAPGKTAPVGSVTTISGPAGLVGPAELGSYADGRKWIAQVLRGNWADSSGQGAADAANLQWIVRDRSGRALPAVFSEHSFRKDDNGNVRPSATRLGVLYSDDQLDISQLSVELATSANVIDGPWIVHLK